MKVIGTISDQHYLAQVTHTELEKLSGNYYGKLKELRVGDEMDLGMGYNFTTDIQAVCKKMTDAMEAFEKARVTLNSFALMLASLPPTE